MPVIKSFAQINQINWKLIIGVIQILDCGRMNIIHLARFIFIYLKLCMVHVYKLLYARLRNRRFLSQISAIVIQNRYHTAYKLSLNQYFCRSGRHFSMDRCGNRRGKNKSSGVSSKSLHITIRKEKFCCFSAAVYISKSPWKRTETSKRQTFP